MNYYEHHLGDYMRDTAHLSMLEDGAYRRLLDAYYIKERPLPKEIKDVFRLVRASSKQDREAVEAVLREFFVETEEGWRHRRCDAEIERFKQKSAKAKKSAEARWSAQRSQSDGNANAYANAYPDAMRTHSEGNANAYANALRTHCEGNALQTPDTNNSVANATGQEPDPIFGDGLAYLREAGIPERGARSLLGKLRKTVGDLAAVELLAKAQQLSVSDPASWLRAAAERRMADGRTGNGVAL